MCFWALNSGPRAVPRGEQGRGKLREKVRDISGRGERKARPVLQRSKAWCIRPESAAI